jgi:hypothetical protein
LGHSKNLAKKIKGKEAKVIFAYRYTIYLFCVIIFIFKRSPLLPLSGRNVLVVLFLYEKYDESGAKGCIKLGYVLCGYSILHTPLLPSYFRRKAGGEAFYQLAPPFSACSAPPGGFSAA